MNDYRYFPYMLDAEVSRVIAARAHMLAANDAPRIPVGTGAVSFNPIDIATAELVGGYLNDMNVARNTPAGTKQLISVGSLKLKPHWLNDDSD